MPCWGSDLTFIVITSLSKGFVGGEGSLGGRERSEPLDVIKFSNFLTGPEWGGQDKRFEHNCCKV